MKRLTGRKLNTEIILWILILVILSAVFSYLFYCQMYELGGRYESDLQDHVRIAIKGPRDYSLGFVAFGWLYRIAGNADIIPVYLGIVAAFSSVCTYYLFKKIDACSEIEGNDSLYRWASVLLIFVTSIVVPCFYVRFYRSQFSMNPWHNSTYTQMRPFALLTLGLFLETDRCYLDSFSVKRMIVLSLSSALATAFKPNFIIGYAPLLALTALIELIQNRKDPQKIKRIVAFACTVLPSLIIVMLQAVITYSDGGVSDGSIVLMPFAVYLQHGNPILKPVLFLLLPSLILLYNKKNLWKNCYRWYRQILLFWAIQMAVYQLFAESGSSNAHGNFEWGTILGNFCLYAAAMYLFIINLKEYFKKARKELTDKLYVIICSFLWIWQFSTGVYYFCKLLQGADYFF